MKPKPKQTRYRNTIHSWHIQIGILLLIALPVLCQSHARSTSATGSSVEDNPNAKSPHSFPKVPLPPSTTSVKCKCQPVLADKSPATELSSNIQSRSDDTDLLTPSKDIEIQIFNSETDLRNSESGQEQKDSHAVFGPQSSKNFKAFRTTQLIDRNSAITAPVESLLLGRSYGPFTGPRRRKRETSQKNNKVFYVYSYPLRDDLISDVISEISSSTTENPEDNISTTPNLFSSFIYSSEPTSKLNLHHDDQQTITNQDSTFKERTVEESTIPISDVANSPPSISLEDAMSQAWLAYGPKSVPPPHLPPAPVQSASLPYNSVHSQRPILQQLSQLPSYSYQFQRKGDLLTSPWDDRITTNPVSVFDRDTSQPGFFSPFLAKYIDFEVNNHGSADFLRKLLLAFVIGTLIAAWIALGVALGVFPLHFLFANDEKTRSNSDLKRNVAGPELDALEHRVSIALDSQWLKHLEDKVKKNPQGHLIHTVAKCCILPKENLVDCTLVRKDKDSGKAEGGPVVCGSNLKYNFQFGGDEDESEVVP